MTSIIKLQPLSGAQDEGPPCYLLQVDQFRFLLDCGWDENFSVPAIKEIKRHIHKVDAVLLTYPDHLHLGALPYLVGKCGLNCPIYATVPVYKMGQMFMYDLYQSRNNSEDFEIFTLDDVDVAFDKIQQLKYSQTINLTGKGHGLQITPLPAGHMIGGTIWKILKEGEEEIVYALDYNHKKERHLNGCILEGKYFSRPHLMITDAFNANYNQSRRRVRDEQLMTTILQTMRRDGNVMIAVDTAGRMLELAQLLDQMWRSTESGLTTYSLALLNNVSFNVIEFAKSQVEWMSDKIMRAFEDHRSNPYHFKHMKLCHNLSELGKIPEPKVVLCSEPDLQSGFSRDLFVAWCGNPKNSIILTNRTSPTTLARWLIDNPDKETVTMEVRRRIRLEGTELEEYLKKKQQESKDKVTNKDDREESSDESETEMEVDSAVPVAGTSKPKHDIIIKQEGKGRSGFFKQAKKSYPMFPYTEERMKWDEYGEIIRPEDYIIAEVPVTDETLNTEKLVAESDQLQDVSEVPTKCIAVTVTLDINASIQYIDFEGRTDGESMRKILNQIKPRQLILVHGSEEATQSLADYCTNTPGMIQGRVFTPHVGETIDATTESHIFQVKLRDYVVSALEFSRAKDAELAWIDGCIDMSTEIEELDKDVFIEEEEMEVEKGQKQKGGLENVPSLEAAQANQLQGHMAVYINEPKLSDFKMVLLQENIQAEFSAGALVCNETIAVRRVVLCSELDLQSGFSRDLFVAWCGNPKNSIILTHRTSPTTLARWLIDNPDKETVTMEVRRRIRLEGTELEEYLKKKQQESKDKVTNKDDREESSDESETEMEVDSAVPVAGTSKPKHDIIIKQEGKGQSGFFKQAKKSYPMFPYTEERMKWDEYGEIIRPEDYIIAEVPVTDETLNTEKLVAESDQLQDVSEVPTKCIAVTVTLDINASIQYIDFEGRTDGESMRKILNQIKPRQLILVHGSEEATQSLADYCTNTPGMIQGRVFTPHVGKTIDATTESHIFQVKLRDYVVSALEFSRAKDAELAWIDGCIDMSTEIEELDKDVFIEEEEMEVEKGQKQKGGLENVPSLEAAQANQLQGHMAVYINEPKLSDFKMVLLQENIQAEFSAGALVCNETIAVRRNEAGRMQLEGAISKDYFRVRDLLYNQYAIV